MEGRLIRLRGYEKSDLDALMKRWHDEEVTQFIAGGVFPASTLEEVRFIETVAAGKDFANKIFAIDTLAEHKYIGTIGLHNIKLGLPTRGTGDGDRREGLLGPRLRA